MWTKSTLKRPKRTLFLKGIVIGSLLLLGVGCSKEAGSVVTLSVAASMEDVMTEVIESFEAIYPEQKIRVNYGGSGALMEQIKQGAPVDIFLSAGIEQVEVLQKEGMVQETYPLMSNVLVVIEEVSEEDRVAGQKKIAVGDFESVPVGMYTQQVLEQVGELERVMSRLVFAKDVREVLFWVEQGHAAKGIVYQTDALTSDKVKVTHIIPCTYHEPISYTAVQIKKQEVKLGTQLFLDFLESDDVQRLWEDYGFKPYREEVRYE